MNISKHIGIYFRQNYKLDLRALASMRIALSLVILADLLIRSSDIEAFYTDSGIWPTHLIKNFGWNKGYWSLHALSGSIYFQYLLFSFHFLAGLSLLVGFKTRWSTLIIWLLYVSLHNRNIYILQGGDDLLRLVLFWGLFLPWGSRYSLDFKYSNHRAKQHTLANIAYLLSIASVYLFSALLKNSDDWIKNFDALYYALSLEQIRLPIGDALYPHSSILKFLTILVYALEWLIPLLVLWPQKNAYLRFTAFLLLLVLHLGIGLHLFVGLFYLIGITSALALLPKMFFDRLERSRINRTHGILQKTTHPTLKAMTQTFLICVIIFCFIVNLGTLPFNPYQLRSELFYPVNVLRLNQNWGMFSPGVLRNDGWFVYHGLDSIGRQWDLRLNQDYVNYAKPQHIVQHYKNDRWRKLAENMQNNNYTFLRPLYCKFILKEWNRLHPEKKIMTLNLYFMEKINLANYKTSIPEKQLYCTCNGH